MYYWWIPFVWRKFIIIVLSLMYETQINFLFYFNESIICCIIFKRTLGGDSAVDFCHLNLFILLLLANVLIMGWADYFYCFNKLYQEFYYKMRFMRFQKYSITTATVNNFSTAILIVTNIIKWSIFGLH